MQISTKYCCVTRRGFVGNRCAAWINATESTSLRSDMLINDGSIVILLGHGSRGGGGGGGGAPPERVGETSSRETSIDRSIPRREDGRGVRVTSCDDTRHIFRENPQDAEDAPLISHQGEITSRATRGNKKGRWARDGVGGGRQRRAQISIRRLRGRGIIASIISAGCTRPLFLRRLLSPPFLSLSLSLFRFLPSSLVFYFRLDVSAGAKAPGCVATNDEGFIGENGEDGRGPRAGRVGGGPGLLPVP